MKPNYLQVFDGLRITTEHMNHLQGSFHSSIQDLREILGLGKVYYGFEVVAGDDQAVTVMPGLAFDFQGNRIISDAPMIIDVNLSKEDNTTYVCIKYEQIEKGKVEERPTMIFDYCSVLLRDTLPEPEENLIPVAKLKKSKNSNLRFDIVNLLSNERESDSDSSETFEDIEQQEEEPEIYADAADESESTEEKNLSNEIPEEDVILPSEFGMSGEKNAGISTYDSADSHLNERHLRTQVRQEILRMTPDQDKTTDLRDSILQPLRGLHMENNISSEDMLLLTLAEKEIAIDFEVISLSCNTIISASFSENADSASSDFDTEEGTSLNDNFNFQSTAQGEVTFTDHEVSQFGISTIHYYPHEVGGMSYQSNVMTGMGIAHLPFNSMVKPQESIDSADMRNFLKHLQLSVEVKRTNDKAFKTTCKLSWEGGITKEIINMIENRKIYFSWDCDIAWKALGHK